MTKHSVTRPSQRKECSVENCALWVHGNGYCSKHYTRLLRYGSIDTVQVNRGIGDSAIDRFWSKVDKNGPTQPHMHTCCWEWKRMPSEKHHGCLTVDGRRWMAHRFSWFLVHEREPISNILHKCDYPSCVNPDHLYEGTQADNVRDMMERGRCRTGERRADAKMTNAQVQEAYKLCETTSPKLVAQMFGVSRQLISNIKYGRSRRSAFER